MISKVIRVCLGVLVIMSSVAHAEDGGLSIKGSNTFGEELGPALMAGFRSKYPTIKVELESKGSASGIDALLDGTCDMASTSRLMNEDEQRLAKSRGIALRNRMVAWYGVAVIVNKDNPVKGLSDHQIRDIFTGAVTNWKELGGVDAPVDVLIRDATGGTHLGFQELAMERKPYSATARAFASYNAIANEVAANANAVGYVGMNLTDHPGVRALHINGMPPNQIAVNEDFYPYLRGLRLYYNPKRKSKTTRLFLKYVSSKEGQEIVSSLGFVALNQPRLLMPGF